MMNTKVYGELLRCAYDLNVLDYNDTGVSYETDNGKVGVVQSCSILTDEGDLLINFKSIITGIGQGEMEIESSFLNNIVSVSDELIQDLILTQLKTEAFLNDWEDQVRNYSCKNIKN